jgi:hypothetical protein
VYVRFRSQSLLSSEAIDGRRRIFANERRQKVEQNERYLCLQCSGYRLMQFGRGEKWNYIDLARRPFLYFFGDWLHIRCPKGKGQILSRRETKSVVKSVVPTRPANQPPTNPPNQPTSQNKNLSGPAAKVGSKESTKAQAS